MQPRSLSCHRVACTGAVGARLGLTAPSRNVIYHCHSWPSSRQGVKDVDRMGQPVLTAHHRWVCNMTVRAPESRTGEGPTNSV